MPSPRIRAGNRGDWTRRDHVRHSLAGDVVEVLDDGRRMEPRPDASTASRIGISPILRRDLFVCKVEEHADRLSYRWSGLEAIGLRALPVLVGCHRG